MSNRETERETESNNSNYIYIYLHTSHLWLVELCFAHIMTFEDEKGKERERQEERQRDRDREKQRERQRQRKRQRQRQKQTGRQTDRQTDRQTNRQTGKQAGWQTETETETEIHLFAVLSFLLHSHNASPFNTWAPTLYSSVVTPSAALAQYITAPSARLIDLICSRDSFIFNVMFFFPPERRILGFSSHVSKTVSYTHLTLPTNAEV